MSLNTRRPQSPHPPNGGPSGALPDPEAIARQKDVYLKMLDEQLNQGMSVLDQQVKYQRDYLQVQVEQQKRQFMLQLEQQMKAQDMALTQQYNEQLMALQLQAGQQKAALEQQAMQLSMEYEQRRAEESMYRQQYDIQRQQMDMAMKMSQDYQRMGPLGAPQGSYAPPVVPGAGAGAPPWLMEPGLELPHAGGSFRPAPGSFRGPVEPGFRPPPEPAFRPPVVGDPALPPTVSYRPEVMGQYRPEMMRPGTNRPPRMEQEPVYRPPVATTSTIVHQPVNQPVYRASDARYPPGY